jgi:4-hydroxythreonine-4-phosphate dehydrogenase
MKRLVVTLGDPAGIGPEVTARALSDLPAGSSAVICGPADIFIALVLKYGRGAAAKSMARAPVVETWQEARDATDRFVLIDTPDYSLGDRCWGVSGAKEGRAAWDALEQGLALVMADPRRALVTAPVSKASLFAAGFRHPGHTDFLAERTGSRAVMMLQAGSLRVVPVTAHLPLAAVPAALSIGLIVETLAILDRELKAQYRLRRPRLAVSALNPHGGEGGTLGGEEAAVIAPAVAKARARGIDATGPFPADSLFTAARRKTFDAAVCMYHDQALIPLKTVGFDRGVNVTLGLPIVRVSPAHGAAFDIAGKGRARPDSMCAAISLALRLIS